MLLDCSQVAWTVRRPCSVCWSATTAGFAASLHRQPQVRAIHKAAAFKPMHRAKL